MREKNVSAKHASVSTDDEYTMRLKLSAPKVNTVTIEAAGSERMEKIAHAVTKLLRRAARHSRYEAIVIAAVVKMFVENVLEADQAEIDRTILMIKNNGREAPVN